MNRVHVCETIGNSRSSAIGEDGVGLVGEEKKEVMADCEGDGVRCFLLFFGLSLLEGEDRFPDAGEETSDTTEAFRMISS